MNAFLSECLRCARERQRNVYAWETGDVLFPWKSTIHLAMVPYDRPYWVCRPDHGHPLPMAGGASWRS